MLSQAAIEEAVLCLLLFSDEQAPGLALRLTDSSTLFTNRTNQKLAQTGLEYIAKYSTAPGAPQLEYILENDLSRGEEGKLLSQQIQFLAKQSAAVDPQFVLEQLDGFLASSRLSKSLQTALELLDQGDYQGAQDTLYKQTAPLVQSSGIWLKDPTQAFRFLDSGGEDEFFSMGVDTLDRRGIRPARKTLSILIAAAGKGKSWWMVEVGKRSLQHHKKLLHITLEMSEERTAKRYLQSIFSLTKDQMEEIRTPFFERDAATGAVKIDFRDLKRDSVLAKQTEIRQKLQGMISYPEVLIKEFPTSTLSTEHLSMYLDSLKREKDFVPDTLIIDYADLMKLDAQALRIDTGRLYRELRGIAVSRNLAMISASQGNRESETAKVVSSTNVAEDWSKIGTADNIITYSQTPEERRLGLARLFAVKGRDAADRFIVLISQAYSCGQFALDSVSMSAEIVDQIQNL